MVAFWDHTLARGRQGVDEDALPLRKDQVGPDAQRPPFVAFGDLRYVTAPALSAAFMRGVQRPSGGLLSGNCPDAGPGLTGTV